MLVAVLVSQGDQPDSADQQLMMEEILACLVLLADQVVVRQEVLQVVQVELLAILLVLHQPEISTH